MALEAKLNYVCSGFRKKSVMCHHSHYIRADALAKMVSEYLVQVKKLAHDNEIALVAYIMQGAEAKSKKAILADKKQLSTMQNRVKELDKYVQRLYEDNVDGKLPFERYTKLSEVYEAEQKALIVEARNLQKQIDEQEAQSVSVEQFIRLIRKQTNVTSLTTGILHELVEKVEVHAPDKSSGKRVQEITIHLNFIGVVGKLDLPEALAACSSEVMIEDRQKEKEAKKVLISSYSASLNF